MLLPCCFYCWKGCCAKLKVQKLVGGWWWSTVLLAGTELDSSGSSKLALIPHLQLHLCLLLLLLLLPLVLLLLLLLVVQKSSRPHTRPQAAE
jgi:hypothetical protein